MIKPAIKLAPSRFPNEISEIEVTRDISKCINCGTCAKVCPFGVHERKTGHNRVSKPLSYLCIGTSWEDKSFYCVNRCPRNALSLDISSEYSNIGDYRWTQDLIIGTWKQAETGMPLKGRRYEIGNSGGGFDRIFFNFPKDEDGIEMDMISKKDKEIISRCAKKYKVSSIYLFGSSLDRDSESNDIDLAVEGIRPNVFFKFYGELLRSLSKPVDLVDLSRKTLFNRIIEEKGVKIYG